MMDKDIDDLIAAHQAETSKAPEHRVQQWHAAIDSAAALERGRERAPRSRWQPLSFLLGAAVSAAIALSVGLLLVGTEQPAAVPEISTAELAPAANLIPVSLKRGLRQHLRSSQQQLASYDGSAEQTALVLQLIEQNRLFENAADSSNAPNLARVLRAFEPILLRLAADDIAPEDAAALRRQLSFELNVMLTKLTQQSSDQSLHPSHST